VTASAAAAEAALTHTLHQGEFSSMAARVYGQFNVGFIIAGLASGDVYIIDQHASDEKARFEALMAHTVLHEQRLLLPRRLDLTAGEEAAVCAHLAAFNANGFHFDVRPEEAPGRRVRLTAVPFTKGITFGDEDVRELASVLADAGDEGPARAAFQEARARGTGLNPLPSWYVQATRALADIARENHDRNGARALYVEYLRLVPQGSPAYNSAALVLSDMVRE
jgi:DNA mismatch repair ATPase MutL